MTKKIEELKEYHKNPRKISGQQYQLLQDSLKDFGDLSGVVVNIQTGEIVGGNQRTRILKSEGAEIEITQRFDCPTSTGTVAIGYITLGDEKYSYREVSWDKRKEEIANIRANKIGGVFDFDILANQFDIEVLQESGFIEEELFNSPVGNITQLASVNKGDENSEWVGMPEFEAQEAGFKIIVHFENEYDREKFADEHDLEFIKKTGNAWSTNYPFTGREVLKDTKYNID